MSSSADGTLPPDAATLIADYYRYSDLADHLRAVPDAVRILGVRDVCPEYLTVLRQLEAEVLARLERLDALGLYPATTADVEVTVNGVPIALPELGRAPSTIVPLEHDDTSESEESMETTIHDLERDGRSNGFDSAIDTETNVPTFVQRHVRPYLGYVATFTIGAMCGVLGARVLGGTSTSVTA
jgi:hypothetical protein